MASVANRYVFMLNIKSLFVTAVLSYAAVFSYAQAPNRTDNSGARSLSNVTPLKVAKARLSSGNAKSHAKKHKRSRQHAIKSSKSPSAKKPNNSPIGLQAY